MNDVDIVNEKNNVIGRVSKEKAHKKGLLHRTVISEVIGSDGRWTLVKQAKGRQDPGQYVSPVGGHVIAGESEENALKREAEEEFGLKNIKFKYIGRKIFNRIVNGQKENHYFIQYLIYSDNEPKLNYESVGFERFTKSELKSQLKNNPNKFGAAFHFVVQTFFPDLV
ncbi:MAG: NUDIX domain-containing protein [Actinobacteria bacterium]|nr:NUDIX domain-containing protein [Actinomycetota bacterium]